MEMKAWGESSNGKVMFMDNGEIATDLHEKYFHVFVEGSHLDNVEAHFECYDPAVAFFKMMLNKLDIKSVNISDEYMAWLTAEPEYNDAPTPEEEYEEACMASACGDDSLLNRWNRKHGIEKEYSPSNPWDAPGMSIHDFI